MNSEELAEIIFLKVWGRNLELKYMLDELDLTCMYVCVLVCTCVYVHMYVYRIFKTTDRNSQFSQKHTKPFSNLIT